MYVNLLNLVKKPLMYVGVIGLIAGGGFYYGAKSVSPKIVKQVEIQEKIIEVETNKKDEKTKKTTKVIEKPDGTKETIITEETETSEESSVKKDESSVNKTKPIAVAAKKSKYSLGLSAILDKESNLTSPEFKYEINLGIRFFKTPLWGTAGYEFQDKEVKVGLRYEF